MEQSRREAAASTIAGERVSAIIRTQDQTLAGEAMRAVVDGGFRVVEFTLTTPGALELIATFAGQSDLLVGAGTVMSPEAGRAAVDAGARFLVSPICDPAVVAAALAGGPDSIIAALEFENGSTVFITRNTEWELDDQGPPRDANGQVAVEGIVSGGIEVEVEGYIRDGYIIAEEISIESRDEEEDEEKFGTPITTSHGREEEEDEEEGARAASDGSPTASQWNTEGEELSYKGTVVSFTGTTLVLMVDGTEVSFAIDNAEIDGTLAEDAEVEVRAVGSGSTLTADEIEVR